MTEAAKKVLDEFDAQSLVRIPEAKKAAQEMVNASRRA
jgi:hypothetical protein